MIDRSILEPIGEVTVNFGLLEYTLQIGIWLLIHGDAREQRTGQILTAENSFRRNVDLFSCLYRHRFPQSPEAPLRDLCAKLFVAEEKRNVVTHSVWVAGNLPGGGTRLKTTAKGKGIVFQSQELSREQILAFAEQIALVGGELMDFQMAMLT